MRRFTVWIDRLRLGGMNALTMLSAALALLPLLAGQPLGAPEVQDPQATVDLDDDAQGDWLDGGAADQGPGR